MIEENYDSSIETLLHIKRVNHLLCLFAKKLIDRGMVHDNSKLVEPEKSAFDALTPELKGTTYGSPEYEESLKKLNVTLSHHYANNSHHPQHYPNGVNGMNLIDLVEMFLDWKAASERHSDGNIRRSIIINKERFELSDQLAEIFENTAKYMGW